MTSFPAMSRRCGLNFCTREQGLGTWLRVRDEEGEERVVPACEPHWQAIRAVPYPPDEA